MEQNTFEKINECPICKSQNLVESFQAEDYFLTGENFGVSECKDCGLKFTNPRPELSKLGAYYKSEEYISHSNTNQGLVNKVYQIVRNYSLKKKYQLINKMSKGTRILDVGCATGQLLNVFKENGWETTGVEPDEAARSFASKEFGLNIHEEEFLDNAPEKSFDAISMWHVLEHVPFPEKRIKQLRNLLADNGYLFIAIPNPDSWDAKKYGKFWAAWDVPRHLLHINQKSFHKLANDNGFKILKTLPMKFDSYYISLLSEKYIHGKQKFLPAIKNGFISNRKAKKENDYSSLLYVLEKSC